MTNKEIKRSQDWLDMVWQNTQPGVEVTAAFLTPIAKNLAETGIIFASHSLRNSRAYRNITRHLL